MAVFETGYRGWNEKRTSSSSRWVTICATGVRRAYKSKWLRRLTMAGVLPLLYFTLPFILFEQSTRKPQAFQLATGIIQSMPQAQMLQDKIGYVPHLPNQEDIANIRHDVWAYLFLTLMRYPQAFLMILVVGIIAPPLISQDLRTRAYLIYFSRPVTRTEYILGKFGVVALFVSLVCALPALLLFVGGLLMTADLKQIVDMWDLPVRIAAAAAVVAIPTSLVSLAISSLTLESRYAAFAWFALWIAGHIVFTVLYFSMDMHHYGRYQEMPDPGWRIITSPYQVLGQVQAAIFGFKVATSQLIVCSSTIAITSILSLAVLFHRVQAPMRA